MSLCAEIENADLILAIAVFGPITAHCIVAWTLPWTIRLLRDIPELKGCFLHRIRRQDSLHGQQVFGFFWHFIYTNWL